MTLSAVAEAGWSAAPLYLADDAAQEAVLAHLVKPAPDGYEARKAKWAAIDFVRAWYRRGANDVATIPDKPGPDPICELEIQLDLAEAVKQLSSRRAAVVLLTMAGHTLAEAGSRMGISESGACYLLTRAKRDLRELLTGYERND